MIKKIAFALFPAAMLSSSVAMALQKEAATVYLGAGVGQSELLDGCENAEGLNSCDEKDSSKKVVLGYRINPMFAFEFAYAKLGGSSVDFDDQAFVSFDDGSGGYYDAEYHVEFPVTSTSISGLAFAPLNENISFFGRLGYGNQKVEFSTDIYAPEADVSGTFKEDEKDEGFIYGIGAAFRQDAVEFRLHFDRYVDIGVFGSKEDVDNFGIEALLHFK